MATATADGSVRRLEAATDSIIDTDFGMQEWDTGLKEHLEAAMPLIAGNWFLRVLGLKGVLDAVFVVAASFAVVDEPGTVPDLWDEPHAECSEPG
jgi:hypothetical protein